MYSLLMAIIGLGVISVFQIVFFKLKLVSTLPTSICVLMLVLYFLAFINALYMIDLIWLLCTFILIPILIIKKPKEIKARIRKGILNPSSLVFIFVTAIVIVGMSSFSIIAYDDFKFWAATVKSLFFQNGYGAPYTNIDINYGDYPQGTLLLLWMGEHCIGGGGLPKILFIFHSCL